MLEPSQLDEDRVLRRHYATEVPRRRIARHLELYDTWSPDLVIRDEVDFAAAVLSEELDIPHAVVLVLAAGSFIRSEVVAGPLDELRAQRGLAADPGLAALHRGLVLSRSRPASVTPPRHCQQQRTPSGHALTEARLQVAPRRRGGHDWTEDPLYTPPSEPSFPRSPATCSHGFSLDSASCPSRWWSPSDATSVVRTSVASLSMCTSSSWFRSPLCCHAPTSLSAMAAPGR